MMPYSDQQLIEMILRYGEDREAALREMYAYWRDGILSTLLEWGADEAQAKGAIHAALTKLEHNIRIRKYAGKSGLKSYLTRLAKKEFIAVAPDQQIIQMICKQCRAREAVFRYIDEQWKPHVQKMLLSRGGNLPDIENATQNAMMIFERNICSGKYEDRGKLKAYFVGICWMQYNAGKQAQHKIDLTEDDLRFDREEENSNPENLMLGKELREIIFKALKMLDNTCREILHLFSYRVPYKEIAVELEIRDELAVAKKVFDCKNKLRKRIDKTPDFKNFFNTEYERV